MPITKIPEQYRLGFARIKALPPEDVERVVAGLKKSPITGGQRGMISVVSAEASNLKKEDVQHIVTTLHSLYVYRSDADTPLPSFVSELISAMRATNDKALVLSVEEENEFQDKVSRLLSVAESAIASKVEIVKSDYAKTFHDAKILTDIRPVFARPEEQPIGAAINHTLKIEYHEEGEHKYFYIMLDATDVEKMRKVLQRAGEKASTLRSLLKSAGVPDVSKGESE